MRNLITWTVIATALWYSRANGDERFVVTDPPRYVATVNEDGSPIVQPVQTTVCQCRGTNRGVCQCLKSGQTCKCSAAVGSVWTVGKPPKKTGEYRNPATQALASKPTAETKPQPAMSAPAMAAPAKATGHWEKRWVCQFNSRGRKTGCSLQDVWVTDQ